jgi:hypothetical protein
MYIRTVYQPPNLAIGTFKITILNSNLRYKSGRLQVLPDVYRNV